MYRYDEFDATIVQERVNQFRGQVARRLAGELTEDQFRPLRLKNGLYLQLHAYMLRVAVPYGVLSAKQMRKLAFIARRYDRGFGHFTTRQNIQYNWPQLNEAPDILEHLAEVEMHAIQTSGNCIRNVTADQFAGVAADEIEDPRIWAEIIRQWSTFHPEFDYLPRKFKIAVTGAPDDRAAIRVHDIGIRLVKSDAGETGFEIWVGGGLGRTPIIGVPIRKFLPKPHLLSYLEAILRTYNLLGRRDNIYKARIKILVQATGAEKFAAMVEEEWEKIKDGPLYLPQAEIDRIHRYFAPPAYEGLEDNDPAFETAKLEHPDFARWVRANTVRHRVPGYIIANVSLKPEGGAPGDASADQMDLLADLAEAYSLNEVRVTHHQNIVFPNLRKRDLYALWQKLKPARLATANLGLVSDIIACPGLDYCNLANARSIPVAQRLSRHFSDPRKLEEIGELRLNISGCINACGHHHVGHIGILGVDKQGQEFYQVTLGGSSKDDASLGKIVGAAFSEDDIVPAVDTIIETYLSQRSDKGERFLDFVRRVGVDPFKEALYGPFQHGALQPNNWRFVGDDAAIPADGPVTVSLKRWQAEAETLRGRNEAVGVRLKNDEPAAALGDDVHRLSVIEVEFPKFTDGRAFSQARILRDKLGFRGELRGIGNILRDQYLYMTRCGIDSVELPDGAPVDGYLAALQEFSAWYQPASDSRRTVLELRHAANRNAKGSAARVGETVAAQPL